MRSFDALESSEKTMAVQGDIIVAKGGETCGDKESCDDRVALFYKKMFTGVLQVSFCEMTSFLF